MRGIDYRSASGSITLIVAAPFDNYREAMQALHRVGRYEDTCVRLLVAGIQLIDKKLEHEYNGRLSAFLNPVKAVHQTSMAVEKKKTTATF